MAYVQIYGTVPGGKIPTKTSELINDSNFISSTVITSFWKGTQAEYDLLDIYDPTTLYIIVEEGEN